MQSLAADILHDSVVQVTRSSTVVHFYSCSLAVWYNIIIIRAKKLTVCLTVDQFVCDECRTVWNQLQWSAAITRDM